MIQDTVNSIRVTLNERLSNPFISAFVIAFILLNWKLSLLIFSDVGYDAKVEKVLDIYSDPNARFNSLMVTPLIFSLFWTFVWPVINIVINAYWYWVKAKISNVKLRVERSKIISEAEAAEIYATIDSQESKYLDFLRDRQNKIDSLSNQMQELTNEKVVLLQDVGEKEVAMSNLGDEVTKLENVVKNQKEQLSRSQRENSDQRHSLDEIENSSFNYIKFMPGLKAITNAIDKANNYQADETWVIKELKGQEPSLDDEDRQIMMNFFMALGFIKKDAEGHIVFGKRYRYAKNEVLGMYNNSPGPKKPG